MKPMTTADFRTLSRRDYDNGAVQDELYAALQERDALQAIVDKLPKTADAVSVVPGMELFALCPDNSITEVTAKIAAVSESYERYWMPSCYSTRELAEAAKEQKP